MKEVFFTTVIFAFSYIHTSNGNKQGETLATTAGTPHSLSQGNVQHSLSSVDVRHFSKIATPDFIFDPKPASSDLDDVFSNTKCHSLTAGGSLKVLFVGRQVGWDKRTIPFS